MLGAKFAVAPPLMMLENNMLWEIEILPLAGEIDRNGQSALMECHSRNYGSIQTVKSARSYLIEGELDESSAKRAADFLSDPLVEQRKLRQLPHLSDYEAQGEHLLNVLYKPGVTDNIGKTAAKALNDMGIPADRVATCRKYWVNADSLPEDLERFASRVLSNDSIERVIPGPLKLTSLVVGGEYAFELRHVSIRVMDDEALMKLSKAGQLYLSLPEMQTIRTRFQEFDRDPTDIELETIAQTWSEHCSHKTLAGRIAYRDENGEKRFENMLKETVFAATQTIRKNLGKDDWCVSVFKDNAGIVTFDEKQDVCIKVETHNHPSALEPYGGANTGLGGVIRDPLGTGMGARPVCNTDVFCFAPPDTPYDALPPGILHPRTVMHGVVAGVRDYGNRMGIPTVNGAVYFDSRYLGNPLVYCGNIAMIPKGMSEKRVHPGDFIVAVGGKTGRDGIHGATFSSAELTHESEDLSGGAVQIGNPITEKMLLDVLLDARDQGLFNAITDCGAGGFSSAVGEMGEETGAEVWLDQAPLKYSGLTYTEIWISEAQERMVLSVSETQWPSFRDLCASEGVEASILGRFTETKDLILKYNDVVVGHLPMSLLHDGRPPVVREATYTPPVESPTDLTDVPYNNTQVLNEILASLNVCSKESIIRQYDHEVQAGSVVKPLVGIANDGPSDAAVVRPDLTSARGLVIACGMNPQLGDLDPYWMAASAIDEAFRNCIAVGADPAKVAILDNFCWGNTERPETLGSLVRAALACHDVAIAFQAPFVSGKDSLNNEFSYDTSDGQKTISIPSSLLITALGQVDNVQQCVTMDLKSTGNLLLQIGETHDELGGSHFNLVTGNRTGKVPQVNLELAPKIFAATHQLIQTGCVRSCHDLSEGGLATALAEMAFAGGTGVDVQLESTGTEATIALFSESNTRFVVEILPEKLSEVCAQFNSQGLPAPILLGRVSDSSLFVIQDLNGETLISEPIIALKSMWQEPLATF